MENRRLHVLNGLRLNKESVKEEGNLVHIEGYACHFGIANGHGEIVSEPSFASFFKELEEGGQMPSFTFNHNSNYLIGGWDSIVSDDKGLYVKGHINTDVAFVRDNLLPLIKGGDLNCLSTEGYVGGLKHNEDGTYNASEFVMTAISLVALPADFNAKTTISENALELKRKKKAENKAKVRRIINNLI